jgi:hypothetical protein
MKTEKEKIDFRIKQSVYIYIWLYYLTETFGPLEN